MPPFSVPGAYLVALCTESFFYGMHVITFATCMRIWYRRYKTSSSDSTSWPWVMIAVSQLILGTLHVALTCYLNVWAFVLYHGNGGPDAIFLLLSGWLSGTRLICTHLVTALCDMALVYRCWLVFAQSQFRLVAVIPPIVLWLAATACGAVNVMGLLTHNIETMVPLMVYSRPYLLSYLSLTLAQNMIATGITVCRLWHVHNQSQSVVPESRGAARSRPSFAFVNIVLIESALVYSVTVLAITITAFKGSSSYYYIADISLQMAGICFDLVLTRLWNLNGNVVGRNHSPVHPLAVQSCRLARPPQPAQSSDRHQGHVTVRTPLDGEKSTSRRSVPPGCGDSRVISCLHGSLGDHANLKQTHWVSMPDLHVASTPSFGV